MYVQGDTLIGVPNPENFTPHRQVRIEDDLWDEFGAVVGKRERSEVTRQLIRAFLKKPGARMPRRSDYEGRQEP